MPASPEVSLEQLQEKAMIEIKGFAGDTETKVEVTPVAFGLQMISIIFVADEAKGSPDVVSEKIASFDEVSSAEISDVRRALG